MLSAAPNLPSSMRAACVPHVHAQVPSRVASWLHIPLGLLPLGSPFHSLLLYPLGSRLVCMLVRKGHASNYMHTPSRSIAQQISNQFSPASSALQALLQAPLPFESETGASGTATRPHLQVSAGSSSQCRIFKSVQQSATSLCSIEAAEVSYVPPSPS